MPTRRLSPTAPASRGRRPGIFHRESTRLRSNVADQVQRDLLPAGRMLSVFLILCELLAEVGVLICSRGQLCDRPLRFWVYVLIVLQAGTVILNCLKIWQGRDTFGQHRNGLSATEIDMYTGASAPRLHPVSSTDSSLLLTSPNGLTTNPDSPPTNNSMTLSLAPFVVNISSTSADSNSTHSRQRVQNPTSSNSNSYEEDTDTQPLLDPQNGDSSLPCSPRPSSHRQSSLLASTHSISNEALDSDSSHDSQENLDTTRLPSVRSRSFISLEFVDRYIRIVNAWYLVWFILGSVWVSDGGTCSVTAPHLYRLIVALTIIYYALLFLPLACFCLIVCCLPLFILVYRIMLPYAERERRRARAADPAQVQSLDSIVYSPETFAAHTENQNPDDANCVICLCEYEPDEVIRFLPCKHHFHKDCVDAWLRLDKACCLCKQDIDSHQTPVAQASSSNVAPTETPSDETPSAMPTTTPSTTAMTTTTPPLSEV